MTEITCQLTIGRRMQKLSFAINQIFLTLEMPTGWERCQLIPTGILKLSIK